MAFATGRACGACGHTSTVQHPKAYALIEYVPGTDTVIRKSCWHPPEPPPMSRQQRRAAERAARKGGKGGR